MLFSKILQSIDKDEYHPVYFLVGDEPYFINRITAALRQRVVPETNKSFDETIYYGKDVSMEEVIMTAKRYPMIGTRRLVVVKEAQALSKHLDKLSTYLSNPIKTTILVFEYIGTADKRKNIFKQLSTASMYFEGKPLYQNQVAQWIQNRSVDFGLKLHQQAVELMSENIGTDLKLIDKELEKLKLSVGTDPNPIEAEYVADHLGIHRLYNIFEFRKALGAKNYPQLYKIADYFIKHEKNMPFLLILGNLYNFFSTLQGYHSMMGQPIDTISKKLKINKYFINEYHTAAKNFSLKKISNLMQVLTDMDGKAKGMMGKITHADLIKELIGKLI